MRHALIVSAVLASTAFAQSSWLDAVGKSGCCNRRPMEHPEDSAGMPWASQSKTGKAIKLKTFVTGWAVTGTERAYELSCDTLASNCGIAILRSTTSKSDAHGSLTHREPAAPWRGARAIIRAELRAGRIEGWAGVWLRVEDKDGKLLAARTMNGAGVKGTTPFRWYSVELEVPENAEHLLVGVELHGRGAVFIREVQLEAADTPVVAVQTQP